MPGEVTAEIRLIEDPQLLATLEALPERVTGRVMAGVMREAEAMATKAILAETPRETGLMQRAVGGSGLRRYGSTLFATAGIRRGFRSAVGKTGRGKLTRSAARMDYQTGFRDPAKVLNVITKGRKVIYATSRKVLYSAMSETFFGKRVASVPPNPFVSRAFGQVAPQITAAVESKAVGLIEQEAAAIGGRTN
jgi:hypothetical protein